MRSLFFAAALAACAGCSDKADKARMNDAGPPPDTGGGKGLPAMKPPGEGGKSFSTPPPIGKKPPRQ